MKKWLIGSLVGAILVFVWQFLSWTFLGIHNGSEKYSPAQDSIVSMLSSNLKEDGRYFMPMAPPGTSQSDMEKKAEQMAGKPFAIVMYKNSYENDMTKSMIRGFIIDLLLVILLISILVRGGLPNYIGIFSGAIAVGLFTFLWGPYMSLNWFQMPWSAIQGDLVDAVAAWGICGLWLGWWLRR